MFVMPMNRHMTWGDRQAQDARAKNLEKLRKLAEKGDASTAQISSTTDAPTPKPSPRAPETESKKPSSASSKAVAPPKKAASKAAPKKATPAKAAKKTKR